MRPCTTLLGSLLLTTLNAEDQVPMTQVSVNSVFVAKYRTGVTNKVGPSRLLIYRLELYFVVWSGNCLQSADSISILTQIPHIVV